MRSFAAQRPLVVAALLITAACGANPSPAAGVLPRDPNFINQLEIDAVRLPGWTAYDLISKLRPQFLHSRGASSLNDLTPTTAVVYLDGIQYGKLEVLRSLNVDGIGSIEFVNAGDATTRYGTNHIGGAILIRSR